MSRVTWAYHIPTIVWDWWSLALIQVVSNVTTNDLLLILKWPIFHSKIASDIIPCVPYSWELLLWSLSLQNNFYFRSKMSDFFLLLQPDFWSHLSFSALTFFARKTVIAWLNGISLIKNWTRSKKKRQFLETKNLNQTFLSSFCHTVVVFAKGFCHLINML